MAIQLYYNPRSRSTIIHWMLDECDATYELIPVDLAAREQKASAFLAINPAGKLPALIDGEARLWETAAICLYLADRFPAARLALPTESPERGRYLSLVVYAMTQLEPAMADTLLGVGTPDLRGWTDFEIAKDVIERELGAGPYLFGERFTAADVVIGAVLIFKHNHGGGLKRPVLEAYVDRLQARPAAKALTP